MLRPVRYAYTSNRNPRAVAAVEFALVAPILVLLLAGIADLGSQAYMLLRLQAAVAAGSNYAVTESGNVNSANGAALATRIAGIVTAANNGTGPDGTVVIDDGPEVKVTSGSSTYSGIASAADQCYCPSGAAPNWSWGSAVSCGTPCAGGGFAGKFVAITASYAYTPLFPGVILSSSRGLTVGELVQTQ